MLCENFWWPFGVFLWEHFRPYLAPRSPIFFLLNFTRILWFFWGIVLTLFDIPKEHFWFSGDLAIVLVHWVPKWTKPKTFGCVPFDLKFKILKDFPNTVPYWRLPLVRISARSKKPQETQKEAISWMLNQYEKLWNFPFQSNCYTGEIYHRLYILIKSFIWQNLGV